MLTSLIVGIIFLLIAFGLFKLFRDALHPTVVFTAVWAVTVATIGLAKPFGYFQISTGTFLVFILGIFSFVCGALCWGRFSKYQNCIPSYNLDFRKIAWFCLAIHAVMLPFSWIEINRITTGAANIFAIAYSLRVTSLSGEEKIGALVGNYLISGLFFVPVLLIGLLQKKIKLWMFVAFSVPWVLLNLLVGGRSGLIILIFTSIYIYLTSGLNISIKFIISFIFIFIFVLISGNLLVGKIDADIEDDFRIIIAQSIKSFFDYFLQGPILFSQYFENQKRITPTWDALIFPCHILEKFDLCKIPPLHQEFMNFSQNGDNGNVYSLFFSIYPNYGWLGLILITGIYGYWANYHYSKRYKSIFDRLMSGFLFSASLLSIYSDTFGPSVYFFIKIFIICVVVSYVFKQSKNSGVNPGR